MLSNEAKWANTSIQVNVGASDISSQIYSLGGESLALVMISLSLHLDR